ncbi:MAG: hypothetical protein KIT09_35410 [Bryobacteraceae bacterium]|nr:hypothetical protein [Bryobacteraceae bacterium]
MNKLPVSLTNILAIAAVAALLSSCGPSGPAAPAPGTPAFNWARAQDAYKANDYVKSNQLLVEMAQKNHEFTDRAQAWAAVMSLGMARTYMELADKLDDGAKRNNTNPGAFRRVANEYRSKARAAALQYTEVAHRVTAAPAAAEYVFVLEPPEASFDDPQQYKKFAIGQLVPDAELAGVEQEVLKREILRNACRALGAPKEPAKARAAYQDGEAKAQGEAFLLMLANGLYDVGDMFGPKKLDQPQRVKLVYDEAMEAIELIKGNKEAQELSKKIAQNRKKLNL